VARRPIRDPAVRSGRKVSATPEYCTERASSSSVDYWDDRAGLDDELAATLDPADPTGRKNALIHALHVHAIRRAGISATDRVLDFGCGTGRLMHVLGAVGGSVSGVDISARMVERAARFGDARLYDGRSLPFDDAAFEVVVTTYVLAMYQNEPEVCSGLMEEIGRVLVRGGRIIVVDRVEPDSPTLSLDAWRHDLLAAGFDVTLVEPVRSPVSRLDRALTRMRLPLLQPVVTASAALHRRRGVSPPYTDVLFVGRAR